MEPINKKPKRIGFPKPRIFFSLLFMAILAAEFAVEFLQHHHYGMKVVWGGFSDTLIAILIIFPVVHWAFYKPGKLFAEKLQESEAMQRLAATGFESSPYGIIILDRELRVMEVNKAFCDNSGYEDKEILGVYPDFLNAHPTIETRIKDSLKKEENWRGEFWLKKKNGEESLIYLLIKAVTNKEGELTSYLAIASDINADYKLRQELITAGNFQRNSLPADLNNTCVEIKGLFFPMQYVSGDHYSYIWDDKNKILNGYLLDVMGHGISTALQISALRMIFQRTYSVAPQNDLKLFQRVGKINQSCFSLFQRNSNYSQFVAAICFSLDLKNNILTISGAGVTEFIIISNGIPEVKTIPGMFLGINYHEKFDQHSFKLKKGDTLIFATDGFTDNLDQECKSNLTGFEESVKIFSEREKECHHRDDCTALVIYIK